MGTKVGEALGDKDPVWPMASRSEAFGSQTADPRPGRARVHSIAEPAITTAVSAAVTRNAPVARGRRSARSRARTSVAHNRIGTPRSEEHTSELQSRGHLVCRLLPEQ